jgi:GNAT superfamily N-acetyltransferase
MKELLKRALRLVLGEYAAYRIYALDTGAPAPAGPERGQGFAVREVGAEELLASPDALIREQAPYLGEQSAAFACFDGERIAGVCFYWYGARYLKRNFWPLGEGEAKLVQLITLPDMRGRGVAPLLISRSVRAMRDKGFARVFARIWHSNTPSLRAFTHAGWRQVALVFEIHPLRRRKPMRIAVARPAR